MKKTLMFGILLMLMSVSAVFATCPSPMTCAQLVADLNSACASNYDLTCNLDCTEESALNDGACSGGYSKTFEGNNHTITGLKIQSTNSEVGLIKFLSEGGKIKNIGLINVNISSTGNFVGGLVGHSDFGSVADSYSTGTVTGSNWVGGLIGFSFYSSVSDSYSIGTVKGIGDNRVGGLIGCSQRGDSVTGSYSTGTVTGKFEVGGLIGNSGGSVTDSYSTGTVISTRDYVGGLIGTSSGSVSDSYSNGTVTGNSDVGGLIGHSDFGSVADSYSTGTVNGAGSGVGGLIGWSQGSITNSYWYNQLGDSSNSCCGAGDCSGCYEKSPASYFFFKSNHPMSDAWSFGTTWCQATGNLNYPLLTGLKGQSEPCDVCVDYFCSEETQQQAECGNDVVEEGEQCDGGDCCESDCTFKTNSTVCRASAGECDVAETCTGSSGSCPADGFTPSWTNCSDGLYCSVNDQCDGAGSCSLGVARNCIDSNECTDDSCNEGTDTCDHVNKLDGTVCSIGTCQNGVCSKPVCISNQYCEISTNTISGGVNNGKICTDISVGCLPCVNSSEGAAYGYCGTQEQEGAIPEINTRTFAMLAIIAVAVILGMVLWKK